MHKTIYFVRHCEPNYQNHHDEKRELTDKGVLDSQALVDWFDGVAIDGIYSSPFKRAYDTVKPLAHKRGLAIAVEPRFCERKIDDAWIEDFDKFCQRQWHDFDYRLKSGESLNQVKQRNLDALTALLHNKQSTIVVGSHGTALATMIHHYQHKFGYEGYVRFKSRFPFVVKFEFMDFECQSIDFYTIFENNSQYRIK